MVIICSKFILVCIWSVSSALHNMVSLLINEKNIIRLFVFYQAIKKDSKLAIMIKQHIAFNKKSK